MADGSPLPWGPSPAKRSPQGGKPASPKLSGVLDRSGKEAGWAGAPGNELIFPFEAEEDLDDGSPDEFAPWTNGRREEPRPGAPRACPGRSSGRSPPEPGIPAALPPSPSPGPPPQRPSAAPASPPGPQPSSANLVKSVSSEMEPRQGSPLKHAEQPLLSLVKSISTEISRLESEVTPSKSDSKLNVHLWRQIGQPKGRDGDSRTAPCSPNTSPSEARGGGGGGFFKAQEAKFEDTKRRFSEAMQEPLQRLSKIMGEENHASPKHKPHAQEAPGGHLKGSPLLEAPEEAPERDPPGTPSGQPSRRAPAEEPPSTDRPWEPSRSCRYEICSYGDVIEVVEVAADRSQSEEGRTLLAPDGRSPPEPRGTVPGKALACVALLAYNYLVLPLPPYVSGLCLGAACGFLLGFLAILLLVPGRPRSPRRLPLPRDRWPPEGLGRPAREPGALQGWMNEMYFYAPEIYHPSVTHSVFVALEEARLTLSYPKNNLPRRATFEEVIVDVAFVSHRHYDLKGAKVFLFPPGLARKRTWNKKYPICILLPAHVDSDTQEESRPEAEPMRERPSAKRKQTPSPETPAKSAAEAPERTLYLFGRTGREKEEWFQHLVEASRGESGRRQNANPGFNQLSPSGKQSYSSSSSRGSTEDLLSAFKPKDLVVSVREELLLGYDKYMAHLVAPANGSSPPESPSPAAAVGSPTPPKFPGDAELTGEPQTAWVNALLGRVFWDFLREKYWADLVSHKIQKKLGRIKLPYFMNELTLTELDMGASIPQILSASSPTVDNRGLWVDMEMTYRGSLQMTLETKMNLYKLGKEAAGEEARQADPGHEGVKAYLVLLADSDAESSSAGSSDEEDFPPMEASGVPGERSVPLGAESHVGGNSTSRKILRFVDKIAKSKYFQKATENEFIKKKMEEVSNTPLLLTVEVQELTGTLAVNIPPPPTDRVWYSFRVPPQLDLKVRPKLGEREVTFIHVTEWIEKKLQHEFQKILVMPHMDDLILPLMHSGLEYPPPAEELRKDLPGEDVRNI